MRRAHADPRVTPMSRTPLVLALLFAAGCRQSATPTPAADTARPAQTARFVFSARAAGGDSLQVALTVRNRADSTVHVSYGACPVELRVLRPGTDVVVWTMPPRPCPMYLRLDSLTAGGEMSPREFTVVVPSAAILDDSLGHGDYRIQARVTLGRDTATVDAGSVRLGR